CLLATRVRAGTRAGVRRRPTIRPAVRGRPAGTVARAGRLTFGRLTFRTAGVRLAAARACGWRLGLLVAALRVRALGRGLVLVPLGCLVIRSGRVAGLAGGDS